MWIARRTTFVLGSAVTLALVLGLATAAATANGDPWLLGRGNVATAVTLLAGAAGVDGPMLRINNNNSGPNATALDLKVEPGRPPPTVDSSVRVDNLNADALDGVDSAEFSRVGHAHDERYYTENESDARYLRTNGKAADADKLDGKDSTEFLGKTEMAADSDKLDGRNYNEIGVNGLEVVETSSAYNSDSHKMAIAYCPWDKILIGPGFRTGSLSSVDLEVSNVSLDEDRPRNVIVRAHEEEPTSANWYVKAYAICARSPYY